MPPEKPVRASAESTTERRRKGRCGCVAGVVSQGRRGSGAYAIVARMAQWIVGIVAVLTIAGTVAQAHHSIAGVYDSAREATVDGNVIEFRFVSPHPFIDMRDRHSGQTWRLDMDNRREFEAIGFTSDSLKSGDRVVVTGSLARREANRMYIDRLDRPADGFGYEQVNSRPRLRAR